MMKIKQDIDREQSVYILELSTEDELEFETIKYFVNLAQRELEHRNRFKERQ